MKKRAFALAAVLPLLASVSWTLTRAQPAGARQMRWHEGSQIEPATSTPPSGYGYLTFDGAYGQTGAAAETAYLNRTAYWVNRFESLLGTS